MEFFDHALHDWLGHFGWQYDASFKLILAAALGGLVGFEREARGREAGLRTNFLVALGSALVMVVSLRFAAESWTPPGAFNINIDPARVAYSVMTGVGFLGAGAILKHGASIRGLTTAAGLWCVSAIGLSCGFGLYSLSILATILVVVALWLLNYLVKRIPRRQYRKVMVRQPWAEMCVEAMQKQVERFGMEVLDTSFNRSNDLNHVDVRLTISYTDPKTFSDFETDLHKDGKCHLMASERD